MGARIVAYRTSAREVQGMKSLHAIDTVIVSKLRSLFRQPHRSPEWDSGRPGPSAALARQDEAGLASPRVRGFSGSVAGDLASVDVQDLAGDERR